MALKKKKKLGIVDYIHPSDEAIDLAIDPETGKPVSDVDKYKETYDKGHLVIKEDQVPTIFKINMSPDYKTQVRIKNASIGGGMGEMGFQVGSHASAVVRAVLVEVLNPDNLPLNEKIILKKDRKTGLLTDETMEELEEIGLVDDLYGFYISNKGNEELLKKR